MRTVVAGSDSVRVLESGENLRRQDIWSYIRLNQRTADVAQIQETFGSDESAQIKSLPVGSKLPQRVRTNTI